MIVNLNDNHEARLKDEFDFLSKKYSNIAFNCVDWKGNTRCDKTYLYVTEGYIVIPQNYSDEVIRKYRGILTTHTSFYKENKHKYKIILVNGPLNSHNYYKLDVIKPYDERINGFCALNSIYRTGQPGDIVYKRADFMNELEPTNGMVKHCYGKSPWGGKGCEYKGFAERTNKDCNHPNHTANLEILNNYRFCLAFESMHHPMWSYDWITERLWNAFKTKTVPVYYGCYNLEDKVPNDLYIDFRKFSSMKDLSEYLSKFDKQKWIDMTEKAYEWYYSGPQMGDIPELEKILSFYNTK